MKIGFFGTPAHSAYLLQRLLDAGYEVAYVVTNPDKVAGRGKELSPPPVKKLATSKGIPVLQPISLKTDQAISEILQYSVDIQIVFAYGAIIPRKIFEAPRGGTINLHGSLLPAFRGASPVQTAILAGLKTTGFSLQYIVEELDAGDLISTGEVEILEDDNFGTLLEKITLSGVNEILRLLQEYRGEKFPSIPQDHNQATFCKKIKPEMRRLDFSESALALHNRIRAYNPGNICYASFRDKRVNVYRTRISEEKSTQKPGSLIRLDKKTLGLVAGDGKILILEEVQPENKKVMSGTDFLNGVKLNEGEKFL